MAIIHICPPVVKEQPESRPKQCPKCGSPCLQRWGRTHKPVLDPKFNRVEVHRYRCTACGHTFRFYPEGVERANQSQRLMVLVALAWALGHSTRGAAWFFQNMGIPLGRMSVWRDAQKLAQRLKVQLKGRRVRVLGLDGTSIKCGGKRRGVVVAVDMGSGEPVAIAEVDERDPGVVVAWLKPLVAEFGVKVIVTDDLASYGVVAEELELKQQVCRFHLLRWANRALKGLEGELGGKWEEVIERVREIVAELPEDGDELLYGLWRGIPARGKAKGRQGGLYRLKQVILRLSERWSKYRLYLSEVGIPGTNNLTEQVVGRLKIRSKSVRGYKAWVGVEAGLFLANCGVG